MPNMDVQSRLSMDTAAFDGPLQKSGVLSEKTAAQIAKANAEASKAVAIAAKYAGDAVTEQSLRIVAARNAEMAIAKESRTVDAIVRKGQLDEIAGGKAQAAMYQALTRAKLETAAASEVQSMATHATVSDMQATSAAVRTFEGNPGIRAVERFITTIPGVGAALKSIFPLVGAAAFAGIAVDMFEKFDAFIKKAKETPEAIRQAYQAMHLEAETTNDQMRLTNTNLENEIAKLNGKPENNLKVALYESWIEADKLAKSLDDDVKKSAELLKANNVGAFGSLFSPGGGMYLGAQETTSDVSGTVDYYKNALRAAGGEKNLAVHAGDKAAIAAAQAKLSDVDNHFNAWLDQQIKLRTAPKRNMGGFGMVDEYAQQNGDPTANLNILRGERANQFDRQDQAQLQAQNGADVVAAKIAKQDKSGASTRDKAAELRYKAMEALLHQDELQFGMSNKAIFDFWEEQKSAFLTGSTEYNDIVAKQAAIAEADAKRFHAEMTKIQEEARHAPEMPKSANLDALDGWKRIDAKVWEDKYDSSNELFALQTHTTAQLNELRIHEAAGRTMTQIAAATAIAASHTKEYGAELDRLIAKQKQIRDNPLLTNNAADQEKQVDDLEKRIQQLTGSRQIQIQQDFNSTHYPDSSAITGASEALQEFTRSATDSSAAMKSWLTGSLDRTNGSIIKAITQPHGQRTDFGAAGHEIFTSATGSLLKGAEGTLLKGLPIDKLGESQAHAMWVRMVTAGSSVASAGGAVSGWLGTILNLLPGHAEGGDFSGNSPFWVGEKGPEIVMPKSAGTVIPNSKAGGRGGDTHIYQIDASNSTDPAQVHAQIMRAAPFIAAAAVSRVRQDRQRTSGMGR